MTAMEKSHRRDETAWLAAYPGAAVRLGPDLTVIEANGPGGELITHCGRTIREAAHRALADGQPAVTQCELEKADATRSFELTLIPSTDDVLVLGRDNSLERRMQAALIESRKRYQDLVAISGDFAWETDPSGAFIFVSPKGALGYAAAELVGCRPADFLGDGAVADAVACFSCRSPVHDATVWLRAAAGAAVCLSTSALPVLNTNSAWAGARGICRDVTETTARRAELANTQLREQTAAFIAGRIRDEIHPKEMLEAAVSALGRALGAAAAIFTVEGGVYARVAATGSIPPGVDAIVPRALANEKEYAGLAAGLEILARTTSYRGEINGAVVLARSETGSSWDDNDRKLLEATARQLGIALRQIHDQQELHRLSNTDALTGLLNRRAFNAALSHAIAKVRREGTGPGALVFVDLDNFKPINDRLGHARGDETLSAVADLLSAFARGGDFAARLGGDEFALWYGNADSVGAENGAAAILAEIESLGRSLPSSVAPLSASIGVAMLDPADDGTGTELLSRADGAMYQAKHGGKGRYAVAAPPRRAG